MNNPPQLDSGAYTTGEKSPPRNDHSCFGLANVVAGGEPCFQYSAPLGGADSCPALCLWMLFIISQTKALMPPVALMQVQLASVQVIVNCVGGNYESCNNRPASNSLGGTQNQFQVRDQGQISSCLHTLNPQAAQG